MIGQRPDGQEPVEPAQSRTVAAGDMLELTADDLVSGGYRWVVVDLPAGLVLAGDDAVGARRTFRLRAVTPGSHEVRLALVRPWEPAEIPPAATRLVRVEVVTGDGS